MSQSALASELAEFEHLTDDLRVHAAHFVETIERIAPALAAEPEIGTLISACTRAIVWCERNRGELMAAGTRSENRCAGSTGLGDFSPLAETMAHSAGIGWRDVDGLAIAYRAGRPVAAVYQGNGGWYWCDLTSAFNYSGGLLAGPWPNQASAEMKACGRFFAICDATPDETRGAIAACPIELPKVVLDELELLLMKQDYSLMKQDYS